MIYKLAVDFEVGKPRRIADSRRVTRSLNH
jgi:hypothetical protein